MDQSGPILLGLFDMAQDLFHMLLLDKGANAARSLQRVIDHPALRTLDDQVDQFLMQALMHQQATVRRAVLAHVPESGVGSMVRDKV